MFEKPAAEGNKSIISNVLGSFGFGSSTRVVVYIDLKQEGFDLCVGFIYDATKDGPAEHRLTPRGRQGRLRSGAILS